jgi:hypothetical protein
MRDQAKRLRVSLDQFPESVQEAHCDSVKTVLSALEKLEEDVYTA